MTEKKVLIGILNWGLGHATRCIPIIHALKNNGYTPVIASSGEALQLLKIEFPEHTFYELPSYNITYSKYGILLKWKLLLRSAAFKKIIATEEIETRKIIECENIIGIISDNCWGVRNKNIPSVFITHQIRVLSGIFTEISSKIQQNYIRKFDQCWIPDSEDSKYNLSGKLSHFKNVPSNVVYINTLSRFNSATVKSSYTYKYIVVLSGPEPQRSILEKILITELFKTESKVLFIRGVYGDQETLQNQKNIVFYNFKNQNDLEEAINDSEFVIARSGYTTVMDLATLEKKAFLIPTPGQEEQEYLAKRLKSLNYIESCKQHEFTLEKLEELDSIKGLKKPHLNAISFGDLFSLFHSK